MHPHHGRCGVNPGHFQMYFSKYSRYMPFDLEEDDGNYYVAIPLPGFEVKDIEVSVKGNTILIETSKPPEPETTAEAEPKRKKIVNVSKFIWDRPISVKIPVEEEIDPTKVKAKLKRGILNITFAKIPKKTIPIDEED